MLGILLIYFIGKLFYELAKLYGKSQWAYAILGVLSYYFGTFLAGIIVGIYLELYSETSIDDIDEIFLAFIAMPFGILTCAIFYYVLKRTWTQEVLHRNDDILDEDLM